MARIEWVKQRLQNWALWHQRAAGGGLGFATQAAFLAEPGRGGYRESWVPCDEVEAGVTDKGVAALKVDHEHLYDTLAHYYLEGRGMTGTALARRVAVSTVHENLGQADARLAVWFTERKRMQAEALAARQAAEAVARGR